ncbi:MULTISPECIES: hypothetical protein [unclassified Rhizobacter]|uniref:hypothetical protein n=1 Tax=unclassified Rhizobacter TaxID=2640088 RepID=UPI0006FAF94D|nr:MULTISPECIES: hypothetical protein [unclassified Rhizobacter]KQU81035.1 hypothetical protein ASC88_16025 [Rhizobacter sp. Root29]KQW04579.1 hypothetical protein ASC98_05715 [Rhizobacter sp. Root1238]KRB06422.1 hypothetical protein ASE08_12275 [Rhizobacter sp. Root16D2]
MRSEGILLVVRAVDCGVRPVSLRLPFRFGAVTLARCPQLFVRATVEVAGRGSWQGHAAELMVPKWFDKRPGLTHADNVGQLAAAVERTVQAYAGDASASAFELFQRHATALAEAGRRAGATELASAFGPAVVDRAVIDALCRALGLSMFDAVARNAIGLQPSPLLPDLRGFDWNGWLPTLVPRQHIEARHTVGLLDALQPVPDDAGALPVSLPAVIARHGHRVFKIKLGGDPQADVQRLAEVLSVLDRDAPGHRYTLDGNEQYGDGAALSDLFARLASLPAYAARPDALLYLEQPLPRDRSFDGPLPSLPCPLLMDEADGTLDAFVRGRDAGWHGVSSKGCKGFYKSLVNRARCERWNQAAQRDGQEPAWFMSAEDLTCQAGLAVQQDLALAALLGLSHAERNGHHYADGFGAAPDVERQAFVRAHPDLYDADGRLRIAGGRIDLHSLAAPGYAHTATPDGSAMQPLSQATSLV